MAFETLGNTGEAVLWVVFAIFALTSLWFGTLSYRQPKVGPLEDRMHYYVTWAIVTIAGLSYYAMASGGGSVTVTDSSGAAREILYARYIDWSLTTPLLLLDLILLGTVNFEITARVLFFDVGMIVTGLFAALSSGDAKWGWYAFGCLFFILIVWDLAVSVRNSAIAKGKPTVVLYDSLALMLVVLWFLYPVVWGFGEGSNTISVDAEVIGYAILDVSAKVVFGAILLLRLGVSASGPAAGISDVVNRALNSNLGYEILSSDQ